jgi:NADH/NAD ratio-sensing transcriptional regulator Rex
MSNHDKPQWMDIDYKPKLPKNKSSGIGIVGAGAIVQACHLPAYRMAGFNIIGIYDVERERAAALSKEFGIRYVLNFWRIRRLK